MLFRPGFVPGLLFFAATLLSGGYGNLQTLMPMRRMSALRDEAVIPDARSDVRL